MLKTLLLGILSLGLVGAAAARPISPIAKCKDFKARGSGKKAQDLLKAFGRNLTKTDPLRLSVDISKAQSKFTNAYRKGDATGGCYTPGDVGPMEAKVDAFAARMLEEVGPPVCGNFVTGGSEECDAGPTGGAFADCSSGTCLANCTCAGCGDGNVGSGEDCDDGAANGTPASCCSVTCQFQAGGTACGDASTTQCTDPDTCDGAGACLDNHAPGGTSCGNAADMDCTDPDTCNGAGACLTNDAPGGTACGDPSNTACTNPDTCNGTGACLANHAPGGTACGDQGVECLQNDTCNGAGTCTDNGFSPGGTACGDPSNTACTDPDTCNGAGACQDNHAGSGAPCGDQGVDCRVDDTCDGGGSCTDNGFAGASTPCTDSDGEECTTAGCDGGGTCDQAHVTDPDSTPCSDTDGDTCTTAGCSSGVCDQAHMTAPDATPCGAGGSCSAAECVSGACVTQSSCCSPSFDGLLSFETGFAAGTCGTLASFRCSNPVGGVNQACVVDADCNFGACVPSGTPFCADNFFVKCPGGAGDCVGTCNEVVSGNLPLPLECGGLYTGGGGNSVPLPFPVPDMGLSYTAVTSCNSGTGEMTTGPTAPGQVFGPTTVTSRTCTTGRTCTGGTNDGATCVLDADCNSNVCTTNCNFGPPLPIPNPGTPPTSVCTVNDVAEDASGTTQCDGGATDVSAPLRANVFLTGDLFQMTTPPDLPGVQPCPLCDTFCVGGTNAEFPCDDDSECNSGNCANSTSCLGGPNDGMPCTPATSDSATLGDTEGAFPTSHDCPPEPSTTITASIGGLPIDFALTSGAVVVQGVDLSTTTGGKRVFSGFCRDNSGQSTQCFEGDTAGGCPTAIPPANGNAVPCSSDADCQADTDEYESCAQRNPGAFNNPGATRISVAGATDGGCLGDGALHAATLVSVFPVPPTFDSTVDAAGDLPGPGAAMISGDALLE